MSARKQAANPREVVLANQLVAARRLAATLERKLDDAHTNNCKSIQRVTDLEFALRETQTALRKVLLHVQDVGAPSDAYLLGMCHATAEEGLLRADNALGTAPPKRRAGDRASAFALGGVHLTKSLEAIGNA